MDELTDRLAANLIGIREERRYSLDDVAGLTGVSKSMLRQIERGESSPSISTVWKLANGLKVPFTALLDERKAPIAVVGLLDGDSLSEDDSGYRIYPIFPFESATRFELYYFEIDAGSSLKAQAHGNGAMEFVLVVAGSVVVEAGGEKRDIGKNHAIRFDASVQHSYANERKDQARGIMLIHYGLE
jgi:transcriptional regulator with XRE-family HTH domain